MSKMGPFFFLLFFLSYLLLSWNHLIFMNDPILISWTFKSER